MRESHSAPPSPLRLLVVAAVCRAAGALGGSARDLGFPGEGGLLLLLAYLVLAIAAGFVVASRWAWIVGGVIAPIHGIAYFGLGPYPPLGRWTSTTPVGIGFCLLASLFLAVISQASSWLWRWTGTSKESSRSDGSNAPDG